MDAVLNLIPAAWRPYAKSVMAVLGTVATVLAVAVPDSPRWVSVVIALATTLGVYGVPNRPAPPVE